MSQVMQSNASINLELTPCSLTDEQRTAIITAAQCIPTGDNAQPFRFKWIENVLEVYHLDALGRHALNYNNQGSFFSLGCLIEALNIETSKMNMSPIRQLSKDYSNEALPWLTVKFFSKKRTLSPLVRALHDRFTDRRSFKSPSQELSKKLLSLTSHPKISNGEFYFANPSAKINRIIATSEDYLFKTPQVFKDIVETFKLTKKEIITATQGLTAPNLNLSFSENMQLRLLRRFPWLVNIIWPLYLKTMSRLKTRFILKNTGQLVFFTQKDLSTEAFINTGHRCFYFWLNLTKEGISAQPMTITPFGVTATASKAPPKIMSSKFINLFKKNHRGLKKYFNWDDNETPTWMFRVGLPSTDKVLLRAPKKQISEVTLDISNSQKRP